MFGEDNSFVQLVKNTVLPHPCFNKSGTIIQQSKEGFCGYFLPAKNKKRKVVSV